MAGQHKVARGCMGSGTNIEPPQTRYLGVNTNIEPTQIRYLVLIQT